MSLFAPLTRNPMLTEIELDELLNRVCATSKGRPPRTELGLWLPTNRSNWPPGGAFGSIDASPALMAKLREKAVKPVGDHENAHDHYLLELIERGDGEHDLYLRYQTILGSRLLGGVTEAQLSMLQDRYMGRCPLADLTQGGFAPAPARMAESLADGGSRITSLVREIHTATSPARAVQAPAPTPPARRAHAAATKAGADMAESTSAPAPTLDGAAVPDAAASRSRRIDDDVLTVLRAGRTEDNKFFLGPERLDPKLYKRVNVVLKDLGGAWKGGKTQAHVFEGAADEAVAAVIASGEYLTAKDFGFFPTPAGLADRAIALAGLAPGMKVLEPSAGDGSLALRAAAIVGAQNVTACEFLDRNVAKLKAAGLTDVIHGDFLVTEPAPIYDSVVMNPPFGNLQDIKHVEHAARFLKPDGVLIAITSPSYQFRSTAAAAAFRDFANASQAEAQDIPAGTFRESGTEVATVLLRIEARNFPWNNLVDVEDESAELAEAPRG